MLRDGTTGDWYVLDLIKAWSKLTGAAGSELSSVTKAPSGKPVSQLTQASQRLDLPTSQRMGLLSSGHKDHRANGAFLV